MATLPYISGTDLFFDDAVPGASEYQIQRTRDPFGLGSWEDVGSPVASSPVDISGFIPTTGAYFRVLPTAGASIVAVPSDAVFYDRNFGSADPATLSQLNLVRSFYRLVHEKIGAAGKVIQWGNGNVIEITDERINYGENEFRPEGLNGWITIDELDSVGRDTSQTDFQITCTQREPSDRFNEIVRGLREIVVEGLNLPGYPLYDYSDPQSPVLVTCGMTGTPMYFAPRFLSSNGPTSEPSSGLIEIILTYNVYLFREAAVP